MHITLMTSFIYFKVENLLNIYIGYMIQIIQILDKLYLFIFLGTSPRRVLIISEMCKYFSITVMKDMTAVTPRHPLQQCP